MRPITTALAAIHLSRIKNECRRGRRRLAGMLAGAGAGALAALYALSVGHVWLTPAVAGLRAACGDRVLAAALLGAGGAAGAVAAMRAVRDATRPWLATLPLRRSERRWMALGGAVLPIGCLALLLWTVALCAAPAATATPRDAASFATVVAALFLAGAWTAAALAVVSRIAADGPSRPAVRATTGVAGRPERRGRLTRAVAALDRGRPAWVGCWSLGRRLPALCAVWLMLMATLGAAGVADTVASGDPRAAVLCAVLGGHLVFLASLRTHTLCEPALRTQPVRFAAAAVATVRLPLFASVAWTMVPVLAAVAIAPAKAVLAAGALGALLALDGSFALLSVWQAGAPAAALLLHGVVLLSLVTNASRLGIAEVVPTLGLACLAWRAAARRYAG